MPTIGQRSRVYVMTAVSLLSLCPVAPVKAQVDPVAYVCSQLDSLATGIADGGVYTCGMNYSPGEISQGIANGEVEEDYFAVSPNLLGPNNTPVGNGLIPNATPVAWNSFSTTDEDGNVLYCGVASYVDTNGVQLQAMQCVAPAYYAEPSWGGDFYS
jgi:hypothetical protein